MLTCRPRNCWERQARGPICRHPAALRHKISSLRLSREASGNINRDGTSLRSVPSYRNRNSRKLMVVDIKRAFLHGYCTRSIYVELPDSESEGGTYVGKLIRALYGTRDAPLAWQTVVKKDMKELGFEECKVTNGVHTHSQRDLRSVAHVDDFLLSGEIHFLLYTSPSPRD